MSIKKNTKEIDILNKYNKNEREIIVKSIDKINGFDLQVSVKIFELIKQYLNDRKHD